ncbi:MAG TPA: DUF4097 family beta strand repeat-containing protein [Gemmatimonadales bacterium]|nr:DUF4097 family beta strand repeat-containing protein [Gemmatimonadales bacterium]
MQWGLEGVFPMDSFWQTWRKEIIRGAVLFVGVIAVGFVVRSMIARVRDGVANNLPVALRNLGDLQELKNLKGHFDIDPSAGPRDTADTWTYRGKIAPRQWVWIGNTNGSVTVEASKGDSLEVVAVKTHHRSDPATVRIETASSSEGIAICALWEHGGGRCGPGEDFKPSALRRNDVAVAFTVRLPKRVRLAATTVNGAVRVARASGPLVLTTVNGEIDAETAAGPVRAVSVNGSVRARMSAFGDTGDVSLFTVNGSASAELPARLDADVEASTVNGAIHTDYPLTVTGKIGKRLKGTIGAGGRRVHITTVNGAINLRKVAEPS